MAADRAGFPGSGVPELLGSSPLSPVKPQHPGQSAPSALASGSSGTSARVAMKACVGIVSDSLVAEPDNS